jgi:hypothetical protein
MKIPNRRLGKGGSSMPGIGGEGARAATIVLDGRLLNGIDKLARPGLALGATLLELAAR